MKKTKYLLIFALPLIFTAGCIDGLAVLSINKDGSGKVTFEGLFDYAVYSAITDMNYAAAEPFFLGQIKKMLTSGGFVAWNEVTWKLLDDGKCYFKGTAYFKDINKTDFFIGSVKSNLKILFNPGEEPLLELKYSADDTIPENQRIESLPPALFTTFSMSLVITLPANIEEAENFELLDPQTAMFVLEGRDLAEAAAKDRLGEYFRNKGAVKLVLASAGKDLFDYQTEVQWAQSEFEKILKSLQITQMAENAAGRLEKDSLSEEADKSSAASGLKNDLNAQLRLGLLAQVQGNFEQAIKIYRDISDSTDTDEKYKARASYHIGVCLFETGHTEQAVEQFEFVLNNYPLQRDAALKSVKMIQDIQSGTAARRIQKKEQKPKPFVVNAVPGLYSEDIDPNVKAITIIFSEPMKKTDWFYSSFAPALMPSSAGQPSFDQAGLEWTVPVKLGPGKVYAIAVNPHHQYIGVGVNYGSDDEKVADIQAGFRSILGQKCENFVLVFATADEQRMPTLINEKIIEECEKINFGP